MGKTHPPPAQRWSGWAWGAIAAVAAFIAITCWWLSRDRGVPFGDAASHLTTAVAYHDLLRDGDLGGLLERSGYYPPLTFMTGAFAMLVGGVNGSAPVIGENLVYASLLALGCYQVGRLVAGPAAGFLAVIFALGSPLLIEQLHVFMIDAPEAALVAVAVWLILASERFANVPLAAAAGLATGAGLASKEQFALYLAGLLAVVLAREQGWRNGRGILAFTACAFVVAAPWYVANLWQLDTYASGALGGADLPARGRPPLLSSANAGWYLWAVMNGLLFVPLFAFAAVGTVRALVVAVRAASARGAPAALAGLAPELLGGLAGGWLSLTLTPHHDMRYAMGLLVYLAVLGTAWIVTLPRAWRVAAAVGLALAVVATTLGSSFGIGSGEVRVLLAHEPVPTDRSFGIPPPSQLTLYADYDFNVSAPRRADDVPSLFAALRRDGITGVIWDPHQAPKGDPVFDSQGVWLEARFAGLEGPDIGLTHLVTKDPAAPPKVGKTFNVADPRHAFLTRSESLYAGGPPCLTLSDGTLLRLSRGNPFNGSAQPYCPPL
jgi:hypothetical protein